MAAHLAVQVYRSKSNTGGSKPLGTFKLTEMFDEQGKARNPETFKTRSTIGGFWIWTPQGEKNFYWNSRQKGYIYLPESTGGIYTVKRTSPSQKSITLSGKKCVAFNGLCLFDDTTSATEPVLCLEDLHVKTGDHLSKFLLCSGKAYRLMRMFGEWRLEASSDLQYVCNVVMS